MPRIEPADVQPDRPVVPYAERGLDFLRDAVAIAEEDARAAGAIGYTARLFAQLALPYRNPGDIKVWRRQNGSLTLVVNPSWSLGPDGVPVAGYPYGVVPRLLTTWMSTTAVRTQRRELEVGGSLAGFLRQLGMGLATGGVNGSVTRLREQSSRTLSATMVVIDGSIPERDKGATFTFADRYELWWSPKADQQTEVLWPSSIVLSQQFYEALVSAPVPVDLRAIKALRGSPLRLDIYTWLTHRMSYLRRPTTIPWEALAVQFGGNYAQLRQFRAVFLKQLEKVRVVYPGAEVRQGEHGLLLSPSRPHVPRSPKAT